jgi:hypothetical protein
MSRNPDNPTDHDSPSPQPHYKDSGRSASLASNPNRLYEGPEYEKYQIESVQPVGGQTGNDHSPRPNHDSPSRPDSRTSSPREDSQRQDDIREFPSQNAAVNPRGSDRARSRTKDRGHENGAGPASSPTAPPNDQGYWRQISNNSPSVCSALLAVLGLVVYRIYILYTTPPPPR